MARRRDVKLMSDHNADWPLWETGMLERDDLALSPALAAAVAQWQEQFDQDFRPDTGWSTRGAQERYARAAAELLHRLTEELGPDVVVVLDPWPVTDPELKAWLDRRRQAVRQRR